jgi:serine protease Do
MKPLFHISLCINGLMFFFLLLAIHQTRPQQVQVLPDLFAYGESALEATVKIETTFEEDGVKISKKGSGVLVSEDGLIVTNYHNIGRAQLIEATYYNGTSQAALLVLADPRTDLAFLRVEGERFPHIRRGNSKALQLGERVFAIGNPHDLDFSLTSGVVSAFNRKLTVIRHPNPLESFIQTDVPINPGCSGGPLLNKAGELVGINTAIVGRSGHFEGYSFAQPVEMVSELIENITLKKP